jgi:hypothetical protein
VRGHALLARGWSAQALLAREWKRISCEQRVHVEVAQRSCQRSLAGLLVHVLLTVVPYLGSRRVGAVPLSVRLLVHLS